MAVSYLATGITASSDTATPFANLSYTLPASTQTGDLLIAFYGGKPFGTVPSTPTDYTARSGGANGSTGMGAGTGSVYAVAFTKTHDGSESNPASTFSAQYSPGIRAMLAVRDSESATWAVTSCKGSDATATSTTYSATGDATLDFVPGDVVVVSLVHNDDSSGDSSFGLSIPGCTIQNLTKRLTGTLTTGTGNDGRMYVITAEIETGTASGAPVVTATTGSGDSDGQSVFLRLHPTTRAGAAALAGTADLAAEAQVVRQVDAAAALAGTAALTTAGTVTDLASAALAGTADLTAEAVVVGETGADLPATADLTAEADVPLRVPLSATASLTAAGLVIGNGGADLTATATLTAAGLVTDTADGLLIAAAGMTAAAAVATSTTADLTAEAAVTAGAQVVVVGESDLSATAALTAGIVVRRPVETTIVAGSLPYPPDEPRTVTTQVSVTAGSVPYPPDEPALSGAVTVTVIAT